MDRLQLQQLAEHRLEDAIALLAARRWGGAYYLLGYVVECALKACVAKQFGLHEVPDKKLVNSFYTHNLEELLSISGVKRAKEQRANVEASFEANWNIVKDWSETERYNLGITEVRAREMYDAVTDSASRILPWLKTRW